MKGFAVLAFTIASAHAQSIPDDLWVIPLVADSNPAHRAEMVLAQSFQGLTGRDRPKLWLDKPGTMSAVLLQQLQDEGTRIHRLASVWQLPDEFWSTLSGAIEYDLQTPHSLNSAISLCGPLNAVAVDQSILKLIPKGVEVIRDVRGITEEQIFDWYFDLFSQTVAVEVTEDRPWYTRDFAVQNNAFTYYTTSSTFRRRVSASLAKLNPGPMFFGWGAPSVSEHTFVSDFSRSSGQAIPCGLCINISGMSRLPVVIPDRPIPSPEPAVEGQRVVAFVLSDGDNIRLLTGDMPLNPTYFANRWRGQITMNWEISPMLPEVAPRVLKYFFDQASESDGFVLSGSPGYRYIHLEPGGAAIDAAQSPPYLRSSHLSLVSVINENAGSLAETIPLLQLPEVGGVLYKPFSPYNRLHGQMCWDSGKPAVSYKYLLWEGAGHPQDNPQAVADAIGQMPSSPQTDPGSYALIMAHYWSWSTIGGPVEAVKQTIDRLPPNTRVVTVEDFFALLKDNFAVQGIPACSGL